MFNLFRSQSELIRQIKGLDDDRQHDRFNERKPGVNYDKFPRPIRPRKSISGTNSSERSLPLTILGEDNGPFGSSGDRASRRRRNINNNGTTVECDMVTTNLCGLSALARAAGYEGDPEENDNGNPVGNDQLQSIAFAFSHLTLEAGVKEQTVKKR